LPTAKQDDVGLGRYDPAAKTLPNRPVCTLLIGAVSREPEETGHEIEKRYQPNQMQLIPFGNEIKPTSKERENKDLARVCRKDVITLHRLRDEPPPIPERKKHDKDPEGPASGSDNVHHSHNSLKCN
jgi:hypothetical protein